MVVSDWSWTIIQSLVWFVILLMLLVGRVFDFQSLLCCFWACYGAFSVWLFQVLQIIFVFVCWVHFQYCVVVCYVVVCILCVINMLICHILVFVIFHVLWVLLSISYLFLLCTSCYFVHSRICIRHWDCFCLRFWFLCSRFIVRVFLWIYWFSFQYKV